MTLYLLDTDTLSRLHAGDTRVQKHKECFDPAEIATTIITRIEILRGRFDFVLKAVDGQQLEQAQVWLQRSERVLNQIPVIFIDAAAAAEFDKLRQHKKLKKMARADLLFAPVPLAQPATLVTRNLKVFRLVRG